MPLDLMQVYNSFRNGQASARENRLRDIDEQARFAQGAALTGNKDALNDLAGLNPQAYVQTKGVLDDQKKADTAEFLSAAYAAKTPEAWKMVVDRFREKGHQFDPGEDDFANRESLIRQGMSVAGQMGLDLRSQQFAAETAKWERQFALQQQQAAETARYHDALIAKNDKDSFSEREAAAQRLGLQPGSSEYQTYVLTGKMPTEQRSTASDRKAIREADDMAFSAENAIGQLEQALAINQQAGSGAGAELQAWVARNDPTGFFDDKKGEATTNFKNLVLTQALGSLKAIFGAAPTEGERAILVDLQASVDKSPPEREAILKRAIALANRRLQFNQERGAELRDNTYYQPGGGPQGSGARRSGGANPPVDADTLIQQANDAIQRGADPEQVRQRLLEHGVEADFDGQ